MKILDANQRLGLDTLAPEDTDEYRTRLKAAWKIKAKQYHPDLNKGREAEAEAEFLKCKAAFEFLLRVSLGEAGDEDTDHGNDDETTYEDPGVDMRLDHLLLALTGAVAEMRRIKAKQDQTIEYLDHRVQQLERGLRQLQQKLRTASAKAPAASSGFWDPPGDTEDMFQRVVPDFDTRRRKR